MRRAQFLVAGLFAAAAVAAATPESGSEGEQEGPTATRQGGRASPLALASAFALLNAPECRFTSWGDVDLVYVVQVETGFGTFDQYHMKLHDGTHLALPVSISLEDFQQGDLTCLDEVE